MDTASHWGELFTSSILGKSLEANTLNISNSKPPPNRWRTPTICNSGRRSISPKEILATNLPVSFTRNDESKQIYNYRLSRARRVVENAFGIFTQKFRLFYGRIQLSPENAHKVVLAACVLHNYLRNDVNVEDCVIENTDALSHSPMSQHFAAPVEVLVKKPCV